MKFVQITNDLGYIALVLCEDFENFISKGGQIDKIFIFAPQYLFSSHYSIQATKVFHGFEDDCSLLENEGWIEEKIDDVYNIIPFKKKFEEIIVNGWSNEEILWIVNRPSVELVATLLLTTQS